MKKIISAAPFLILCSILFGQTPWENTLTLVNRTGADLARIKIIERQEGKIIDDKSLSLPNGSSIQIDISGDQEITIDLEADSEDGKTFFAWDIDPKWDAFILLEREPTYYSAGPVSRSKYRDIIRILEDTTWVQLKKNGENWEPDPKSYLYFAYGPGGNLELKATFLNRTMTITDAEHDEEANIIMLYAETVPGEKPFELLDIKISFDGLPEGLGAFKFGDSELFVFAPLDFLTGD